MEGMKRVLIVRSVHQKIGKATARELHWLLNYIRPNVLFLECSPVDFPALLDDSYGTLESAVVMHCHRHNEVMFVPVDQFHRANEYVRPDRSINLADYEGHHFDLWSSTPAVLWTSDRPQEQGIHLHIYEGDGPRRIIDDTFGEVIYRGRKLDRKILWQNMTTNTLY